jgi:hypothetical protein
MLIKRPPVCVVSLVAPCSFCADRVAAESASSNADLSRTDSEAIEQTAPAQRVYQPGSSIAMNSEHEVNREII